MSRRFFKRNPDREVTMSMFEYLPKKFKTRFAIG